MVWGARLSSTATVGSAVKFGLPEMELQSGAHRGNDNKSPRAGQVVAAGWGDTRALSPAWAQ